MNETLDNFKTKVDKKLIARQAIFFIIIIVLFGFNIVNVFEGDLSITTALASFFVSTLMGLGLSRMFRIFWHEEKEMVMSKLDTFGGILLIVYISIELGKNWIFGHWFSGPALTAIGLIVLTGFLLGRFLGTLFKIHKVLSDNELSE